MPTVAGLLRLAALVLPCLRHIAALKAIPAYRDSAYRLDQLALMNFTNPGLCYSGPMTKVYKDNWEQIETNVARGRQRAAGMKVLFAGLIRDAAPAMAQNYRMLRDIGRHFQDYQFLVFESDSIDSTPSVMRRLSALDPRYEYVTDEFRYPDLRGLESGRMERMARLRNRVRDWVESFSKHSRGWDLTVLYDFDNENPYALSPHSFFNSLGREEAADGGWDVLCANGLKHPCGHVKCKPGHYDCFAFRSPSNDSYNSGCEASVRSNMFAQYDLVPVHSCFGGMAMYRTQKFLGCRYDPRANDCEHVGLHKCMRKKGSEGRVFMDPLLALHADSMMRLVCTSDASYSAQTQR